MKYYICCHKIVVLQYNVIMSCMRDCKSVVLHNLCTNIQIGLPQTTTCITANSIYELWPMSFTWNPINYLSTFFHVHHSTFPGRFTGNFTSPKGEKRNIFETAITRLSGHVRLFFVWFSFYTILLGSVIIDGREKINAKKACHYGGTRWRHYRSHLDTIR